MNRAHSLFEIKALDDDQRIIEGFTSTPTPDRVGDVLDPKGASFKLPLPLLWQHRHDQPIGKVLSAKVTAEGIWVKAQIAKDVLPFIEEAWALIKAGLVSGFSVGWKPLAAPKMAGDVAHYARWMWGETSVVTIPANAEATIALIKSLDVEPAAAIGPADVPSPAGVPASPVYFGHKDARTAMNYAEKITDISNRRAANEARMVAIQTKAADEGRTKDEAEREEFDGLQTEIAGLDLELKDYRALEAMNLSKAVPVQGTTPALAGGSRSGSSIITVKPNVPPGTAFTRMCIALAAGHGDSFKAMERAKTWNDSTPEVELMVKAAVAAGSTTDSTWAGPLVVVQPLVNEFLELLRPRTLLGRIPGLRRVPFNVSVPSQTTGGTYSWVGQNKPKPVTKADYATVTLTFAKAAGIIVLTEELVKLSTPSAEGMVREEMIAGMGQFLDTQFVDPTVAAVSNVNPASITNGASTAAASGVTGAAAKADLAASVAVFTAAGIPLEGSVWLMSDSNAFGLGLSMNALGQPLFPGVGQTGGSIFGIPIIVSNNVGNRVILVHAPSILYADDGGVSIDVSREASVQMDSTPTDTVDATTVYVSLWQRNLVGLKAERFITWTRARTAAVRYISAAAYNGT